MWLFPALVAFLGGCAGVHDVTGTASQDDLLQLRGEVVAAQQAAQRARTEAEAAATRAVDARMRGQTAEGAAPARGAQSPSRRAHHLADRADHARRRSRLSAGGAQSPAAGRCTGSPADGDALDGDTPGDARPLGHTLRGAADAALDGRTGNRKARDAWTIDCGPIDGRTVHCGTVHRRAGDVATSSNGWARPSTNALQPQDIYQASYIDFSKGSYALAMAGFAEFIRRFPDHALAGNAQYWIGESHFSIARGYANSGQTDKVAPEYGAGGAGVPKVIANYPRGEKAPTALYKEALALLDLKQPAVAQQRLRVPGRQFPAVRRNAARSRTARGAQDSVVSLRPVAAP